jgi:GNAT superfamily N-acetyltransferase
MQIGYVLNPFLFLILIDVIEALSSPDSSGVRFRPGTKSDELQISIAMTRNLMNPLGIDSHRVIVAVNPSNTKKLYGWAQLRPIGPSMRDPEQFDALPGSGSIDKQIDDEIWDEFEKDEVEFPNGFASLPWTKEYREFAKSSAKRREQRENLVERAGREERRDQNQLWELASVFVLPEWRNKGIGSELIRRVMAKHTMLERRNDDVYLLTLESTSDWYRGFGFELTDDIPASMALEVAAGGVLTKLLGEKLVAMQGGKRILANN